MASRDRAFRRALARAHRADKHAAHQAWRASRAARTLQEAGRALLAASPSDETLQAIVPLLEKRATAASQRYGAAVHEPYGTLVKLLAIDVNREAK